MPKLSIRVNNAFENRRGGEGGGALRVRACSARGEPDVRFDCYNSQDDFGHLTHAVYGDCNHVRLVTSINRARSQIS